MHEAGLTTQVFYVLSEMKNSDSLSELDKTAERMFGQLNYTSFSLARFYAPDRSPGTRVLAGRFEPSWSRRYIAKNYAGSSVIARHMLEFNMPYTWTDALKAQGDHAVQRKIIGEASEHGLREGLFSPIRLSDRSFAAVVVAGWDVPSADPLHRMMTEVLAARYHHEVSRLLDRGVAGSNALTRRQRDCLSWVRHGKSSTDIGELLGISPQTVEEHIAAACRRLGVRTRLQAAVEASLYGLLD